MSAEEAFMLSAGNLNGANTVANRIARRAALQGLRLSVATPPPLTGIPRPARVVAQDHRPAVLPGLVAEAAEEPSLCIRDALATARIEDSSGFAAFGLLDRFRQRTGCTWETSTALLITARILPREIGTEALLIVAAARRFWGHWTSCRRTYKAAVQLRQVKVAGGNWALVEVDELPVLLPGSHRQNRQPGSHGSFAWSEKKDRFR